MMKKSVVILVLVLLFSLQVVVGAECTVNSDCSGQVCDDGECVNYCGIGETECSDGDDDDGDGLTDYVADGSGDPECRSLLDTDESSDPACADGVSNEQAGTFADDSLIDFPNDPGCDSPEDDSEKKVRESLSAPETEKGFFAKLLDFLFFWN